MCGGESADQQTRFRQDLHLWWYNGCWSLHTGKCEKYIEHVCTRLFQLWSRSNKNNIKSSSFRRHGAPLNSDSRLYCRLLKMALLLLYIYFFILGIHASWIFYSTIPVDVVRVKSYIYCLFDPARVVIRVTINTLYFVPEWLVSGVMGYALKWATKSYASLWPFRSFYDEQFFYNIDVAKQRDMMLFHWTVNVQ